MNELGRRYANALYSLANESKVTSEVSTALAGLTKALSSHADLREFLTSPAVPKDQKLKVVESSLPSAGAAGLVKDFFAVLVKNDRVSELENIEQAYEFILDEAAGMKRGRIYAANPLSEAAVASVEASVGQILSQRIKLTFAEEKSLLGGCRVQVGGWTIDDSFISHLNRIRDEVYRRSE